MPKDKILIVEDEQAIGDLLLYHLRKEGYEQIVHVQTGEAALEQAADFSPDLILLDLMLPGIGGLDVCRRLKADPLMAQMGIIMLTAKSDESDIIVGLELGADDYVTKPFAAKLLLARIRSVLRRTRRSQTPQSDSADVPETSESILISGPLEMNLLTRQVRLDKRPMTVTVSEFNLLHFLAGHADRVFTRSRLIVELRGDDYPVTERAMDVLVLSVRRKLAEHARRIETIRGVGYRWIENLPETTETFE